ncbi:hypothetical protein AV274_3289 [Blastocystis sp. ATCC 50177/Nand II]|uniref:Uncharacterized protein n=1 Tax=Blastocystis sp. subtype 1 (strain ATCC 50177 / NandII) TaxID=478820 RepID=A0A196SFA2_BLAHN|nr:hypothetical protein AV274_3289 [Blastocystis sp. ATCC 50177/Nand II]
MQKKIIGIDCDEVLCLLMKDFIPYMSKKLNLGMKYEDMKEYDLNKYFHLDKKPLEMVPGAREALLALSTKYRLVLITGRVEAIWKESTEYWINHNFQGVPIEKLIYANDRYCDNTISKDRPVKSILCEEEHISIFIDDRERYVYEVALPSSHHI